MSSAKLIDPAVPTSLIPTFDLEIEPVTVEEMKSKIEKRENQVQHMKETHSEGVRFQLYIYTQIQTFLNSLIGPVPDLVCSSW